MSNHYVALDPGFFSFFTGQKARKKKAKRPKGKAFTKLGRNEAEMRHEVFYSVRGFNEAKHGCFSFSFLLDTFTFTFTFSVGT